MSFAVVDQGSSSTKAALVGKDGALRERLRIPVATRVAGDRVEQDPEEILGSVRQALQRLCRGGEVRAVGLSCQRSTCLLWERASGAALTPALSWRDRRTARMLEAFPAADRRQIAARTGLRLSPHYAGSKLAWLLDATAGGRDAAARGEIVGGTLDAFLVRGLTGSDSTEPGHAGRTLLYDLEAGDWSPWLLSRFTVPAACLPAVETSVGSRGSWEDIPLRVVLGDQQAALLGHGEPEPGTLVAHFGTGAFVLAATGDRIRRHEGLLSAVSYSAPDGRRFQLEGAVNSAGSAVDWMAERLGFDLAAWSPEAFDLESVPICVPAFEGLGAPWWEPEARAAVVGLGHDHQAQDLMAGVMAGVVMRVVDNVEALAAAGLAPHTVRIAGPLARIPALGRLLADASGCCVDLGGEEEAGLVGLARLLGSRARVPIVRRWEPSWGAERRQRVRQAWRELVRETASGRFLAGPGSYTLSV